MPEHIGMDVGYAAGAVALALVHLVGRHLHFGRLQHRRRWLSLAAGVSVAYVFVDMLPLMSEKQLAFLEKVEGRGLPLPEFRIYVAALIGFTLFYGLEHLVGQTSASEPLPEQANAKEAPETVPWLHVGGFALYNLMVGYLLIEWGRQPLGLALYCLALGLHLLITDEGLRRDYGEAFDRWGRWLMAACVLTGALAASLTPLSVEVLTSVVRLPCWRGGDQQPQGRTALRRPRPFPPLRRRVIRLCGADHRRREASGRLIGSPKDR